MRHHAPAAVLLVALAASLVCAQSRPAADLLEKARRKFESINDYSTEIRLDMKGDKVSIKGMTMKLYYKKPDKTRVIAKQGFAALPKDVMVGSPLSEMAKSTRGTLLRTEKKHGKDCYVIQLDPSTPSAQSPSVLLWLERSRLLVVATSSLGPHKLNTRWSFTRVDGKYDLPSRIDVEMTIPGDNGPRPTHATLRFSSYRVNKGISDSVFAKPEKR